VTTTAGRRPYLLALGAVAFWSTVASAFKLTLAHLQPVQLLLGSSVVSCLALGLILLARGQLGSLRLLNGRQWFRSAWLGGLNPTLYYWVLLQAYDRLPAQEAQALNYSWALVLTYLSVPLLGQRLRWTDIAAGLVCYGGVVVVATRGRPWALDFADPIGTALALGSTVIWALYWIYNTRDDLDPVLRLFMNFCCAMPWIGVVVAIETWAWPGVGLESSLEIWVGAWQVVGAWQGWAGAAYIGLFEMGIPFVLWLTALRTASNASRVSNLIFLSPFVSLLLIGHLVGETILAATWIGLLLIMAGLGVQRWGAGRDVS
jgi:drug/metabolite transporter (DMT)-like permease